MPIAVDATTVFWLEESSGRILAVNKLGGTPVVLASDRCQSGEPPDAWDLCAPRALTIDDGFVYWVNTNGFDELMRIPKSGGAATQVVAGAAAPLTVDATHAYYFSSQGLARVPKGGGAPEVLAPGLQSADWIDDPLAVDAESVFALTNLGVAKIFRGTVPAGFADGRIMSLAKSGGTPVAIACDQADPGAIVVDASGVYWTTSWPSGTGSVVRR